jgi:hypothetical protein
MLNLRYNFPAEWAAFVNSTADFAAMLTSHRLGRAPRLIINGVTLSAANGDAIVQVTPEMLPYQLWV